jgi:hypothetical protein
MLRVFLDDTVPISGEDWWRFLSLHVLLDACFDAANDERAKEATMYLRRRRTRGRLGYGTEKSQV